MLLGLGKQNFAQMTAVPPVHSVIASDYLMAILIYAKSIVVVCISTEDFRHTRGRKIDFASSVEKNQHSSAIEKYARQSVGNRFPDTAGRHRTKSNSALNAQVS